MSIKWITFEESMILARDFPHEEPQCFVFPVDPRTVRDQIPILSREVPADEAFSPGRVNSWYAQIGSRVIVLEWAPQVPLFSETILLLTSFQPMKEHVNDWTVLLELSQLPKAIDVSHPIFIASRADPSTHFVYRRQLAGWDLPLYRAGSLDDAEGLLAHLQKTPGNESCLIGEPEVRGQWEVIANRDGNEVVIACYPEKSSSLRFACEASSKSASTATLIVRNRTRTRREEHYIISIGRVIASV
jgi:hypothetical protein